MTKIFEVILRLLSRHLAFTRLYRAYMRRFRRSSSVENLIRLDATLSDVKLRTKRGYHSDDIKNCNVCGRCYYCAYSRNFYLEHGITMPCRFEFGPVEPMACTEMIRSDFLERSAHSESPCDRNDNVGLNLINEEFQIDGILGSGGFGSVFLAKYCGQQVAIKNLKKSTKNKRVMLQSFRAELNGFYLKHENVVDVLATSALQDFDEGAFIMMEYAGRRNLQHIINNSNERLDINRRSRFAEQVINALSYTHSQDIVHLDIKPSNIIVNDNDVCKLGDFGCSQRVINGHGTANHTNRSYLTGTYAYRAPELLRGDSPTAKADIYSFGVMLWQMLSREHPYAGENHHVVIFGVVAYNLRPKFPDSSLENANEHWYRDLIVHCWKSDMEARPTAQEVTEVFTSRCLGDVS